MTTISPTALQALMQSAGEWALFDIREAGEADAGHIPGASFLPRRMLESKLAEFVQDRATPVVVYDEGGARAALAAEAATRAGYRDVRVLDGGVRAWERAGFRIASGSNVPSKHFGEEVSVRENVPQLPPQTLRQWQAEGKPHFVCDIRTPEEYKIAHIPRAAGAFGVDVALSAADLAAKAVPIVVHCAGRTRSIIACETLRQLGVPEVYALEDGTMGWTLAGFELERDSGRVLEPTPDSVRHMTARARSLGEAAGVSGVSSAQLLDWLDRRAAGEMNLYLFDVRQVPRYEEGHVRGARALPGGLAIQRTDEFVAVRNAHIVLVEDDEARAWMTGYWLSRMGFPKVHVLAGGLVRWQAEGGAVERGRSRTTPLLMDETRRATTSISQAELRALLDAGWQPLIVDVDTSKYFSGRHLPGARWIPYGSLEARIGALVPAKDSEVIVSCHNGVHSTFAAANLARMGYANVRVLDGGTDKWAKAGLPVDKGLGDATPDDIVVPPYNSSPEAMAKYLEWEEADAMTTHDASFPEIREAVRDLCKQFPDEYFRKIDEKRGYPEAFVDALTKAGWLAALIPQEYGGSGLSLTEASVIMEEINRSGGNSGACHGQMYNMGTLLRHGSAAQKEKYLPKIATGELRLQSMAVTEPTTGTDTTKIKTTATKKDGGYLINGQKVWISRVQHSDLMIVLARTTPLAEVRKKSEGMSIFVVDVKRATANGMTVRPIMNMVNHETNELFFDNVEVADEDLIGKEGLGFKYILDGLNAERALIAGECIGDGRWFVDRITKYANERHVFDRPIGKNQGVQFPIARAHINVEAASLMRFKATELFDHHKPCGAEANMAKLLAADASWEAANVCLQFHGGFGFATEYDVERKFRETRLYQVAPISTNLILSYVAEHVLGLPRSF